VIIAIDNSGNLVEHLSGYLLQGDYDILINHHSVLDLLNIFAGAYFSDISVKRANDEVGRNISFCAPVSAHNIEMWNDKIHEIERLLNFVTEADQDIWHICFTPITYELKNHQYKLFEDDQNTFSNVSLLSGGLDSFCGIHYNELESSSAIYCAYKTSTVDTGKINSVFNFARSINPRSILSSFEKLDVIKQTNTQRTRSLLFLSLACCLAKSANLETIRIFENGIMSLNPSFESRGTTRTTHPNTIYQFQNLINHLQLKIKLTHPYLFNTKGEMIKSLPEPYQRIISETRSCSRSGQDIRFRTEGINSCGACVPCLLRKISLSAYDLEMLDHGYYIPYAGSDNNTEYLSSYNYFQRFANAIDNDTILGQLGMRKRFYSEEDYLEQTESMLKTFRSELEVFFKKYGR